MSQSLLIEVSDEVYAAIRQQAQASGISPASVAAKLLEAEVRTIQPPEQGGKPAAEAARQAARARFEQHFGEMDLGYTTGSDNEAIDADLGREYADVHEDQ